VFWESVGYALGYAEAALEHRDRAGAARNLEWFRAEAARWEGHPDYPAETDR
jgi:hypothetical protein